MINKESKSQPQLCECGCGDYTEPGNRFIHGHNRKNCKASEETKKKQSIALTGRKPSYGFKGHKHTKKTKLKQSQNARDSSGENNPNYGKDMSGENNPNYGHIASDKTRKKKSDAMLKFYQNNPEKLQEFIESKIKYQRNLSLKEKQEFKEKMSKISRNINTNKRWNSQILNNFISGDFISDFIETKYNDWRNWNKSIFLNDLFPGCARHHITKFTIICIPIELHKSVHHCLKTKLNMKKINSLSLNFLLGTI